MQTARSALAVVGVLSVIGLAHMGSAGSATSADDRARAVAEAMAEAASKEFNAFENRQRVAQADTSTPGKPAGSSPQPGGPWQWLQDSRDRFQALMRRLAGEQRPTQPWDPVADAGRKTVAGPPAKTAETNKIDAPPPASAATPSKPAQVAGAKPPGEERKLAEVRRGEADKADAAKGKAPPPKTEAAKPAETAKATDTKPKAADAKPAAEAAKPAAPKSAEAPRAPAKEASAKAPEGAPSSTPDARKAEPAKPAETRKQDAMAKTPEPAAKVAAAPPASTPPASAPAAKPEAASPKAAAPPAAKPEMPAKTAENPKAAAPEAKQQPAAKETASAKQPGAGDKSAAGEPPAAKADVPSGIPTEMKPPPRMKGKSRPRTMRTAAACRDAGRRVSAGNWYTVREGDSLWRIARRHLGDGRSYPVLRAANRRAISDPDHIRPCQRIYIPRRNIRGRS